MFSRFIAWLGLALLFASGPAAPLRAQSMDPGLAKAISAHQSGNMELAIREYRAYLKQRPNSLEARSNLGAALSANGQFAEAIVEYRAALKLSPSNPGVSLNLALAYYKSGELTSATRELSALRALVGDQPQVTMLLADSWLQLGEHAKVIQLLEPLLPKAGDDLGMIYLLGSAYIRDNQLSKGQQYLDRILRNGDSAEARLLIGTAKFTAADFAGALEELQKAVQLNPKVPMLHTYYGQALMATGDTAGAATAFTTELATNPNDFNANLNLAVILKQDQKYDEALQYLGRALRLRPGDIRVRYQTATILMAQAKTEAARTELEAIVKEAPKFSEAHVSLATVYYRLKRKADGDRERQIVQQLTAEAQNNQPKGDVKRFDPATPASSSEPAPKAGQP